MIPPDRRNCSRGVSSRYVWWNVSHNARHLEGRGYLRRTPRHVAKHARPPAGARENLDAVDPRPCPYIKTKDDLTSPSI